MKIKHLFVTFIVAVSGCGDPVPIAQFTADDCHRLTLLDRDTGKPVRGAEDLVQAPDQSFIIVSAYDRWATEHAARSGAAAIPRGNLYRLFFTENSLETEELVVGALKSAIDDDLDFRPHGLDLFISEADATLAVINRRYAANEGSNDSDWRMETTLEVFDLDGSVLSHLHTIRSKHLCRANNVAVISATEFLVTRDHGACEGFGVTVEDVFGLVRGKLLHIVINPKKPNEDTVTVVAEDLAFPNGLALDRSNGRVYVATTRNQSLQVFSLEDLRSGQLAKPDRQIALPASPDNLALSTHNKLIFAAHPSLLRLGFYRNQWFGVANAPSQIYSMTEANDEITLLFDDPGGHMMSAATTAVLIEDNLIAGSVSDEGLLVCRPTPRTNS